jgi:hypothetical protein
MLLAALLILAQETSQASPLASPAPSASAPAAAATISTATPPKVWSIKADPCASARTGTNDIVVCGNTAPSPRLPLPDERGPPDHPAPSNPYVNGTGALAATAPVCHAKIGGCPGGVDLFGGATFLVRAVGKAVDPNSCCDEPGEATNPAMLIRDIARVFKKKDKRPRIPIPLDDSPMPWPKAPAKSESAPAPPTAPTE